jgi:predicted TPR repeat methyltransferase
MTLLDDAGLERSPVVANSRMNRERQAVGVNSYARELGFDPLDFLRSRLQTHGRASWLDLCCGRGRALLDASATLDDEHLAGRVRLTGVDLVDMFEPAAFAAKCLKLEAASLHTWQTDERFDLITCVHGFHYIGDKLGLVERAATWLAADGMFAASLDLANLRREDGRPLARLASSRLRKHGFEYHPRRRLLTRTGHGRVSLGFNYVGANDAAGPNYSGQEAVNSCYAGEDVT